MMMERILLGVLYLSGWNIASCLVHQYHYVANPMTWTEAQTYCRETYTDLATIDNTEEMNQLTNTVASFGYDSEVWIGLYIKIDWRWSDGYNETGAEYRNWQNIKDNEPDFYGVAQLCVNIGSNCGGWWDDGCSLKYAFICYRAGTQLDSRFVVVNDKMNWSSAQRYCREHYTDLATVRNDTENQEIQMLVPSGDWAWIGLSRDPNSYWSDGSGSSFRYWRGTSKNIGSSVVCAVAALQSSGTWWTESCKRRLPFVCYSVPPAPVMRQVVKLRIKRGDSSLDLNDPAVKADMLKQFQDRLKEKGVSGVTLKWREQPDGRVFHEEGEGPQKRNRKKTEL